MVIAKITDKVTVLHACRASRELGFQAEDLDAEKGEERSAGLGATDRLGLAE